MSTVHYFKACVRSKLIVMRSDCALQILHNNEGMVKHKTITKKYIHNHILNYELPNNGTRI